MFKLDLFPASESAMDAAEYPFTDDPASFLAWLLGRLRDELGPAYTWESTLTSAHSSYEDWHVWGLFHNGQQDSSVASRSSVASKDNVYGQQSPSALTSPSPDLRRPSRTPSEESTPSSYYVLARVSKHILRLDRQYQLARTSLAEADPHGKQHLQALQLRRLPARSAHEPTLAVMIHRNPGVNNLAEIVSCGPSEYSPPAPIEPPNLRTFLSFAIGAAECCEMLHQGAKSVHGELRADSFHWNAATGDVKLISLGSGVRSFENGLTSTGWTTLSREYGVEHKLQFVAPEQTGRLPAAADSRTDLYSLGILFWIILTGEIPFHGDTPLEIMQNVLSHRIPPVSTKRLDVPDALSNIIQKLVQRNIGARYFSAAGLKWDLQEIQRFLEEGDSDALANFQVGSKDVNSFFTLPNAQVGREKQKDAILKVIERVARAQKRNRPLTSRALSPLGSSETFSDGRADGLDHGVPRAESHAGSVSTRSSGQSNHSQPLASSLGLANGQDATHRSAPSSREDARADSMSSVHSLHAVQGAQKKYLDKRLSTDGAPSSLNGGSFDSENGRGASISSLPDSQISLFRQASKLKKRDGKCEIVAISGAAGMGKSSLVHSIQGPARQQGYFATAKFDQVTKTPFEPVLAVLSSIFRQIFSESDVHTDFHQSLRAFVKPAWPVLSAMLGLPDWLLDTTRESRPKEGRKHSASHVRKPSIHLNSPSQCGQAGHTLDDFLRTRASSKSSRFTATFIDVLRYLSTQKVIVFSLDDIQWADGESTELLQAMVSAKVQVILLLTRRSREALPPKVSALLSDPLRAAHVTRIELGPLSEEEVAQYVASTLHREAHYIFPLVAVIQEKTNGNPFFVRECLDACYRRKCLWYSWQEAAWVYDLDKVFQEFSSESYGMRVNNDFIATRLLDLPLPSRQLIAWASLIGATFSFNLVKTLMMTKDIHEPGQPVEVGETTKQAARNTGLARQTSQDVVKALQGAVNAYIIMATQDDDIFRFCHDRYQTSAAALSEAKDTSYMHFCIADVMLHDPLAYSTYIKASHVCLAVEMIRKRKNVRSGYRDILYQAGERAIESGGQSTGLNYFVNALTLLQDNPWDESQDDVSYPETLVLYHRTAECYYLQGQVDKSTELIEMLLTNVRNVVDKVPAWILQSRIASRRGDFKPALDILSVCLSHLGIVLQEPSWEECDKRFWDLHAQLKGSDKKMLLARDLGVYQSPNGTKASAESKDPAEATSEASSEGYRLLAAAGAVLCEALGAAFWSNSLLFYQLSLLEIEINLHRGMVSQAGLAYIHLAIVAIGRFDEVEFGCEMGEVAMAFLEQHQSDSYTRGRGYTLYSLMVGAYSEPIQDLLVLQERALELSLSAGDRWSALLNIGALAAAKLWCSHDMVELETFCAYGGEELANWQRDVRGGTYIISVQQFARALQGKTRNSDPDTIMDCDDHEMTKYFSLLEQVSNVSARTRTLFLSYKMWANYLYGQWESAIATGESLINNLDDNWSNRMVIAVPFYLSLSYLAVAREDLSKYDEQKMLTQAKEVQRRLVKWCTVSDVNFASWAHILAAEIAEFEHRYDKCLASYEAALDHAEVHGLALEQALASELYGEFMIRRGSKRSARAAINEAILMYQRISAFGKSSALSSKHEWLLKGTSSLLAVDVGVQTDLPAQMTLGQTAADRTSAWVQPDANSPGTNRPIGVPQSTHDDVEGAGLDMIDLTSILRSSQVLASELNTDKLYPKLTKMILEATAAELCAIVIEADEHGWMPAAITDHAGNEYAQGQTLDAVEDIVGKQITLYTLRFKESVFINNLYDDVRFSNVNEAYKRRNPLGKAVIAMPIIRGELLLGCIYVEGAPNSFTERNMTVLRLLVNSIGISIANAMLFKKLERLRASNEVMIESQKHALSQARQAERKAKAAEMEATRNLHLAEEAAKAKSMFLANVSHELRTPLNGVIGMSELLKGTKLNTEQDGFADSIRVCADTLLTVINDILDYSKLEAGKMQLFSVPLSLTETINEVVRALSYSNAGKDLETVVDLQVDENLLVIGDPVRLHQVFMNLLSNAYKFTPAGKVIVKAVREAETDQELTATFSVEDSGIGISEEQKKKLFQPFSQADSSTARSYGGTGLGLSICRAILENVLKGKIWLESELGRGTKVSFTLKFAKAPKGSISPAESSTQSRSADPMAIYSPTGTEEQQQKQLAPDTLPSLPRSEIRVCIAEDNPVNQRIAVQFVTKLGFQCEAHDDGRKAVDAIVKARQEQRPFHIVLMDVQMPHLDGYDATREIRRHEDPVISSVLIIAMTASAIRGDREKCLEAGMNNYLAKPVRQQVLKQMLEGYLGHGDSEVPPADRSEHSTPQPAPPKISSSSSTTADGGSAKVDDVVSPISPKTLPAPQQAA